MIRVMGDLFQVAVGAKIQVTFSTLPADPHDLFDEATGATARDP